MRAAERKKKKKKVISPVQSLYIYIFFFFFFFSLNPFSLLDHAWSFMLCFNRVGLLQYCCLMVIACFSGWWVEYVCLSFFLFNTFLFHTKIELQQNYWWFFSFWTIVEILIYYLIISFYVSTRKKEIYQLSWQMNKSFNRLLVKLFQIECSLSIVNIFFYQLR